MQQLRGRLRFCLVSLLIACASALAGAPAVHAGTVVDIKTVYFDGERADETATIYFDQGRVRFDALESGRRLALIVRKNSRGEPLCWVIDEEQKSYVEINEASVKEVQSQLEKAREFIEERISKAPPEKRDEVRRGFEAQYGPVTKKRPVVEFKKISSGVTVKKWRCTQYEGYVDGNKQEDLWTAGTEDIGISALDLQALAQMGVFFSGISPETNAFFQFGKAEKDGGFAGFPVLVVEYKDGEKSEKSEVTGIHRKNLNAALFDLPLGLTEQKLVK